MNCKTEFENRRGYKTSICDTCLRKYKRPREKNETNIKG